MSTDEYNKNVDKQLDEVYEAIEKLEDVLAQTRIWLNKKEFTLAKQEFVGNAYKRLLEAKKAIIRMEEVGCGE